MYIAFHVNLNLNLYDPTKALHICGEGISIDPLSMHTHLFNLYIMGYFIISQSFVNEH